jgi:hypothetical protein
MRQQATSLFLSCMGISQVQKKPKEERRGEGEEGSDIRKEREETKKMKEKRGTLE